MPRKEHAGQEEQGPPLTLAWARLCFFQKSREYSGVDAFMPHKETEGGAFSNAGWEGFVALEVVTAVATVMGMSGPQLTMVPLEIFKI